MVARQRPSLRSRVVGLLKVGLPAVAVALLAAVFLLSDKTEFDTALNFSEADLEALRSGLKLTEPQFSGASLGGDIYDFRASLVTPRDLAMSEADILDLRGRVAFRDGRIVDLRSDRARLDAVAQQVVLEDGIELITSDGYRAEATRVEVDIEVGVLTAAGPVRASGPAGEIEAATLRIARVDDGERGFDPNETLITFAGGVRLRYLPGELESAE